MAAAEQAAGADKHRAHEAFQCADGSVTALKDAICYRCLDGRPCGPSAAPRAAGQPSAPPIVIVPITYNRAIGGGAASAAAAAAPLAAAAAAPLAAARSLAAALARAGLHVLCDEDGKLTAGAKFHRAEQAGRRLRLEVGPREAAAGACCLAVHVAGLGEGAVAELRVALDAAAAAAAAAAGGDVESVELAAAGGTLRLRSLPAAAAPGAAAAIAACLAAIDAAAAGTSGGGGGASRASACGKLHLWCRPAGGDGRPQQQAPEGDEEGVCVAHLRYLLGLSKRCHCRHLAHPSQDELRAEVAARLAATTGRTIARWLAPADGCGLGRRGRRAAGAAGAAAAGGEEGGGGGGGGEDSAALFLTGMPRDALARDFKRRLEAAVAAAGAAAGARLVVAAGARGRCIGWGRAVYPSYDAADAALAALGGRLAVAAAPAGDDGAPGSGGGGGGAVLEVAHACGRCDTLFPRLPAPLRCRLRVDAVGAFSVTEQHVADAISDALHAVVIALAAAAAAGGGDGGDVAAPAAAGAPPGAPHAPSRSVLDATACCGGNTLSFMARFARVTAVEFDPERLAYLRHNVALLQRAPALLAAEPPAGGGASAAAAAVAAWAACSVRLAGGSVVEAWPTLGPWHDAAFFDPPWGGPNYKAEMAAGGAPPDDLPLGGAPLSGLCGSMLAARACAVVGVRLPRSMDVAGFCRKVAAAAAAAAAAAEAQPLPSPRIAHARIQFGGAWVALIAGCAGGQRGEAALAGALADWAAAHPQHCVTRLTVAQ